MSNFKVGQIVKLIKKLDNGLSAEIGDTGRIEAIDDDPEYPIGVFWFKDKDEEAVHPSEIIIVEEEIQK
ncbi:hypothetical protein [Enterococcus thailandicus]|uniref:hypothetical protein n=1 Tax=Enterococcus thailandicus TaxID=417368 RepID=UPI0035DDA2D1